MSSQEKVHLSVDYNRINVAGERYSTGTVFYAITQSDGHWGIQMRSPVSNETQAKDQLEILEGARAAVLDYMIAFNGSDGPGSVLQLNFPHFFMMGGRIGTESTSL